MRKNLTEMQTAIKKLESTTKKALSADELSKYVTNLARMNKETINLARNMKGVRLSTLGQDLMVAEKSFQKLFGSKDRTSKFKDYAAKASKKSRSPSDARRWKVCPCRPAPRTGAQQCTDLAATKEPIQERRRQLR